jgi:hypothetical protein
LVAVHGTRRDAPLTGHHAPRRACRRRRYGHSIFRRDRIVPAAKSDDSTLAAQTDR